MDFKSEQKDKDEDVPELLELIKYINLRSNDSATEKLGYGHLPMKAVIDKSKLYEKS